MKPLPRVYYRSGFWRVDMPDGRVFAAPTIPALTACIEHPWFDGWIYGAVAR